MTVLSIKMAATDDVSQTTSHDFRDRYILRATILVYICPNPYGGIFEQRQKKKMLPKENFSYVIINNAIFITRKYLKSDAIVEYY